MTVLSQYTAALHARSGAWENGGLQKGIDLIQRGSTPRARPGRGGEVRLVIRQEPYGEFNPPPRTRGSSG